MIVPYIFLYRIIYFHKICCIVVYRYIDYFGGIYFRSVLTTHDFTTESAYNKYIVQPPTILIKCFSLYEYDILVNTLLELST